MKIVDLTKQIVDDTIGSVFKRLEKTTHVVRKSPDKPGRNDPCPCGSGKKYKNCCMNLNDSIINKL